MSSISMHSRLLCIGLFALTIFVVCGIYFQSKKKDMSSLDLHSEDMEIIEGKVKTEIQNSNSRFFFDGQV